MIKLILIMLLVASCEKDVILETGEFVSHHSCVDRARDRCVLENKTLPSLATYCWTWAYDYCDGSASLTRELRKKIGQ